MTTVRSFSLGRTGEAQWESLRGAYVLSRSSGEIVLVASDSRDVRDEVRRRLQAMAPRVEAIEPGKGVTLAIHACAKARAEGEKIPIAWIEAPPSSPSPESDMQWVEALAVLNQTRDALQMHGPCHVVLAGPRALHRVVTSRAPDLTSFMGIALLLDDTLENLVTQQGTLTWLHLSDLHVLSESWQQDHVLKALVRDLPKLLEERELRPDLLFVTGDVAARGQRAEYDGAFIVLKQITGLLGLDRRERVFVVAGNHDVERGRISGMAKGHHAWLMGLETDALRSAVGELLGDAKDFARYGDRLTEWCAFTDKFLGPARSVSSDRPWRSDVVDVGGLAVGVLSLCTAWASGPDDRKGSLILGERQVHDMVAEARDAGAHLKIVLMHHPLHWLHDGEYSAIRGRLERDVDVVLHGHVHDAHSALHVAGRSAHVEIGAGAVYGGLGQDLFHGFSVGRLDLAQGRLDVHAFTWSTRGGKWHADAGAPGADDRGRVSFPFSPAGIAPEVARNGGQEVLATRLRHAAAKVYATADFAGLGAGGPRRHVTLEQIFVPLQLTAVGLKGAKSSWFKPEEDDVESDDLAEHDWIEYQRDLREEFKDEISRKITLHGLNAMLAAGRKVVVLGGPGSGKSTLAKYLASAEAGREGGSVPLLFTVRDWIAEGKQEHLLDMAARHATRRLSVRTDRDALEELCEAGRAMLIVDGVDEAADATMRRELRTQLHGFVIRFSRVPVLVTSRIAGYHDVPLDDESFDELTLEPFDDEALEQFVRRWYDLVEDDPAARLRKRVDLLHALEVEPRAKELARNPLLATLIGMVHFSHAQLPSERAKLYGKMVELLLVTWPAEHKRELPDLHGAVQQPMLEKLALQLQEQRTAPSFAELLRHPGRAEVSVDEETLISMLDERLEERFPERDTGELRYLARRWYQWLLKDSGLLQEQEPGRVSFLHLSLMEYMAGQALLGRSLQGGYEAVAAVVKERHIESFWRETLLLMLGSESKNRALGMVVMEWLLKVPEWNSCEFGLALLREDVEMGELRERLLACTCDAVVDAEEWWDQEILAEVVRFSRTHGQATRQWLQSEVMGGTGERWLGALILATKAIEEVDVTAWVEARQDRTAVVLALLDLGANHTFGRWAQRHRTRDIALEWANSTPLEGVLWRSFEGVETNAGAEWIPALLARSAWMARTSFTAAERFHQKMEKGHVGLPEQVTWLVGEAKQSASRLCPAWYSHRGARDVVLRFGTRMTRDVARLATRHVASGVTSALGAFPADARDDLATRVKVVMSFAEFATDIPPSAAGSASDFPEGDAIAVARFFAKRFGQVNESFIQQLQIKASRLSVIPTGRSLWAQLCGAATVDPAQSALAKVSIAFVAEVHAGFLLANEIESVDVFSTLATTRIQNRWLNLFFTPLVDHATRTRPLASHPELHALLLTYGLVQYQTTWEWPDCPHWRSWFSSDPPAHWLPAHVFHLIRSIQDPTDPTHRQQADAALDRNDWPELAQALRETTLVPTPPEILALFDHGNASDDPSPSS